MAVKAMLGEGRWYGVCLTASGQALDGRVNEGPFHFNNQFSSPAKLHVQAKEMVEGFWVANAKDRRWR